MVTCTTFFLENKARKLIISQDTDIRPYLIRSIRKVRRQIGYIFDGKIPLNVSDLKPERSEVLNHSESFNWTKFPKNKP